MLHNAAPCCTMGPLAHPYSHQPTPPHHRPTPSGIPPAPGPSVALGLCHMPRAAVQHLNMAPKLPNTSKVPFTSWKRAPLLVPIPTPHARKIYFPLGFCGLSHDPPDSFARNDDHLPRREKSNSQGSRTHGDGAHVWWGPMYWGQQALPTFQARHLAMSPRQIYPIAAVYIQAATHHVHLA
jgi:hypothetical protein